MALSEASCIIGQKGNERAQIALSSFIHALDENDLLALARLVTKDGKNPVMVVLAPSIDPEFECLVDVQVAFHHTSTKSRCPLQRMYEDTDLHL